MTASEHKPTSGYFEGKGRPVSDEELDKIRGDLAEQDLRDASSRHSELLAIIENDVLTCSYVHVDGKNAVRSLVEQYEVHEKALRDLRHRSDSGEVLGVDISDYSDEFCAGFLAGQSQALDQAMDSFPAKRPSDA